MNESCSTLLDEYEWVMYINKSFIRKYEWVMYMNASRMRRSWISHVLRRIWMSLCVMSHLPRHIWMSHVPLPQTHTHTWDKQGFLRTYQIILRTLLRFFCTHTSQTSDYQIPLLTYLKDILRIFLRCLRLSDCLAPVPQIMRCFCAHTSDMGWLRLVGSLQW